MIAQMACACPAHLVNVEILWLFRDLTMRNGHGQTRSVSSSAMLTILAMWGYAELNATLVGILVGGVVVGAAVYVIVRILLNNRKLSLVDSRGPSRNRTY